MKYLTLFFSLILGLTFTPQGKAQFYTITRDSKQVINDIRNIKHQEEIRGQKETQTETDTLSAERAVEISTERERSLDYKKARERYSVKSNKNRKRKKQRKDASVNSKDSVKAILSDIHYLPELTVGNLIAEIKKQELKHPEIVLAQAILETGWFTSPVCKNKNNLFGLTNPRTKEYYEFSHWTESVKAYYTKVQYRYKGGNYLYWPRDIGYAEAPNYIQSLTRVIRTLRKL